MRRSSRMRLGVVLVDGLVSTLVDEGVVRLHASPRPLPPYLAEDHFAAPPEVRRQQMKDDGFI